MAKGRDAGRTRPDSRRHPTAKRLQMPAIIASRKDVRTVNTLLRRNFVKRRSLSARDALGTLSLFVTTRGLPYTNGNAQRRHAVPGSTGNEMTSCTPAPCREPPPMRLMEPKTMIALLYMSQSQKTGPKFLTQSAGKSSIHHVPDDSGLRSQTYRKLSKLCCRRKPICYLKEGNAR